MKTNFEDLLKVIGVTRDRDEFLQLARRYREATDIRDRACGASDTDERAKQLLDQIMHQLHLHFRNLRYPMPSREEMAESIQEHFG